MSFCLSRIRYPLMLAAITLALGGCARDRAETTGSISPQLTSNGPVDWRARAEGLGEQYRANPNDPNIAIAFAQALRNNGQEAQAVAVMQQTSIKHPQNRAVLGAYGRALADTGQYQQALDVFTRAHSPDAPDWRILNAQGTVLDQMGRHNEAQRYYKTALKIVPDEPAVLSNLGLSYALSKQLPQAETALRTAAAHPSAEPKVRQNLALVLGLEGKFDEAEKTAAGDLPPEQARENVAELRAMMAQQNPWQKLKSQKTAANG